MKRILLYVEPQAHERDHLVAWAADLVEVFTAPSSNTRPALAILVGVVADVLNCLEIGVVTLGRGAPRTVEGGERNASPVTLFPFKPTEKDASMTEWANAYECLRELADGGAVEGIREGTAEDIKLPDAQVAFRSAIESGDWEIVITLGESERTRAEFGVWFERSFRNRVFKPLPDEIIRERVDSLLRRVKPEIEDNYRKERLLAVRNAVQFVTMLEQLGLAP